MLKDNDLQRAKPKWTSSIFSAPKIEGSLRFCIDYRKVNAVKIRDSYSISQMDECIASFGSGNVFSTLSARSAYGKITLHRNDSDKTSLVMHDGLFPSTRIPYGLKNAPEAYQRAKDNNLEFVKWKHALVYFNNVVIFSESPKEHLHHVITALRLIHFDSDDVEY